MPETVNLKKSFSSLNEKLAKLFDESGIRRTFTVPYIEGQQMSEHIGAVGAAAEQSGGLVNSLVTTSHASTGKGWGSGDGQTTGHPAEKLRTTIIPKGDEHAKAVIDAAQKHMSNLKFLLGDEDPTIQTSQNQLNLVKKAGGAGMNLLDFGVMMNQIFVRPNQAVARAHSGTKDGGHAPQLRAAGAPAPADAQETAQGAPQGGEQASEAPAAPETPAAPPAAPAQA